MITSFVVIRYQERDIRPLQTWSLSRLEPAHTNNLLDANRSEYFRIVSDSMKSDLHRQIFYYRVQYELARNK